MTPKAGTGQVTIRFRLINIPEFYPFPFPGPLPPHQPLLIAVDPSKGAGFNIPGWLTPSEQKKAETLNPESRRHLWKITHSVLNCQLAILTDTPSAVPVISTLPGGKPILGQYSSLHFNLADTHDLAVLAFSHSPVGIDVERVNPDISYMPVIQQYFSKSDAMWISDKSALRFYLLWTRKEAILKLTGAGLTDHLANFTVSSEQWIGDSGVVFADQPPKPFIFVYSFFTGSYVFSLACYHSVDSWESLIRAFVP